MKASEHLLPFTHQHQAPEFCSGAFSVILILRNSSDPSIAGCRLTTGYLAVRISDPVARPSGPLNSQPRRLCRRAQLADDRDRQANSSSGGERYYSLTTGMQS